MTEGTNMRFAFRRAKAAPADDYTRELAALAVLAGIPGDNFRAAFADPYNFNKYVSAEQAAEIFRVFQRFTAIANHFGDVAVEIKNRKTRESLRGTR